MRKYFIGLLWRRQEARLQPRQSVAHRQITLIQLAGCDLVNLLRVAEHVTAIRGQQQLEQISREATAGFDDCEETLRGQVEATQHTRHVQTNFSNQPIMSVRLERLIDR